VVGGVAPAAQAGSGTGRRPVGRRAFLRLAGAAAAGGALSACSPGASGSGVRPIRLGYVSPQSGPFVSFGEADGFVLDDVRARLRDGLTVGRRSYPVEIVLKDSQSDPGRAATVAGDLLRRERIDLMLTSSTPETTNPVADVCERAGVPYISTFTPWQSHFFGRKGDPEKPFRWTYHFYWGLEDVIATFTDMWDAVPTNKVVGALWPDDPDGYAWSNDQRGFPPELTKHGYRVVDPGRYHGDGDDYRPLIRKLQEGNVEIITGVPTPPDFATFWKQAGDEGLRPKVASMGRALLFPAFIEAMGPTAEGLTIAAGWSPSHPFRSSLTGATAAEIAADYTSRTERQWTQPIGFAHALFEVAIDVLRRAGTPDDRQAIVRAIAATELDTVVGRVSWAHGPLPNIAKTPLVGGQWRRGGTFPFELAIVSNRAHPEIGLTGQLWAIV
jgi:branched-chain amino acid transport system substrate-binding protein